MDESKILIVGANGQLGKALQQKYTGAQVVDSNTLDITDKKQVAAYDWSNVDVLINAAAYTNVDGAESAEGRVAAWQVNAVGAANLAKVAMEEDNFTIIHISTDYVFDGTHDLHTEDEPFAPLGVYGQTKAAGDIAISLAPKHYLLRTSWVIGSGANFVRSIYGLGQKGLSPKVVADQFGRPTFTTELVRVIEHFLSTKPVYGTYNASNGGDIVSWAAIARQVYQDAGYEGLTVGDTTAAKYFAGKLSSPRPMHSGLDLTKLQATGFTPRDWRDDLKDYIKEELAA
jgi:dTDP-4-dehydrorhamnose 3,5-epimerase/reductase